MSSSEKLVSSKKRKAGRDAHFHFVLALIVDTHSVSSSLLQAQTSKGIVLHLVLGGGNENVVIALIRWEVVMKDSIGRSCPAQGVPQSLLPRLVAPGAAALHLRGESLPSAPGVLSTARVTITAAVQRPLGITRATIPDIIENKGRSNGSQHSSSPVDLVNSLHRIKVYGRSMYGRIGESSERNQSALELKYLICPRADIIF